MPVAKVQDVLSLFGRRVATDVEDPQLRREQTCEPGGVKQHPPAARAHVDRCQHATGFSYRIDSDHTSSRAKRMPFGATRFAPPGSRVDASTVRTISEHR